MNAISIPILPYEWRHIQAALKIGNGILAIAPKKSHLESQGEGIQTYVELIATHPDILCLEFPAHLGEIQADAVIITETELIVKGKSEEAIAPRKDVPADTLIGSSLLMAQYNPSFPMQFNAKKFAELLKRIEPCSWVKLQPKGRTLCLESDRIFQIPAISKEIFNFDKYEISLSPETLMGIWQVASSISGAILLVSFPKLTTSLLLMRLGSGFLMGISLLNKEKNG